MKKCMLKTNDFLRPFFSLFGRSWVRRIWGFGLFLAPKINVLRSFFEVAIFYRFSTVLARFWEGLGRIWGGLGTVWGGFGEGWGRVLA